MKLTGVFVIETGVVNRGDGIGNIATVKKITTPEGLKVFFSPVSYKRALWSALQRNKGWSVPIVTREGGVVQRTGTIIDSEEFDFAGTMVAKPKYERYGTFLVDNGISINNYFGDMEFMTNMAIAKLYGEDEANIINKENFYGIYIMPFGIELDRVGIQEITTIDTKIKENDRLEGKIKKIYKALKLDEKINEEMVGKWAERVENIEYNLGTKATKIVLKQEERKRRLKELLEGMGELAKRIEGSERNLSPYFSAFSLDYIAPKYLLPMKDFLKKKVSEGGHIDFEKLSQELENFAQADEKTIKTADYMTYNQVIDELIKGIFKES
ncbi:MAG TPA: type I-B CRISPR-associated protein Cas7/Cst2/DevR [Candidatus Desulfofervidus auxilii]|uniref:Type I-B CRISPR-associated protein Cas7/Cst2/DevR n=1 Tax=Desulfofervidus auxilii TaxID=1621989 RepID=A0A7C0Y1W5_DESA2|nr:MAG: type I-B CRISPR-associated protein Cas7/Cst2/DevR [Thermodesulfobacteriota bacterium]HDD43727.1 type I-B CRISPR-associated protein Cas7/Cst2/DevR [Candidatus Desulfofervidus auxilii]